ncbi:MAG: pyridoxal phosphate-dependent aminotransferase [Fimbriimonadaceae bacterium]
MPIVSQRGQKMPPSPVRKLAPYADAAKARGVEILHLNIGQPDLESPAAFWEAVKGCSFKTLEYGHASGLWELREEMAAYYRSIGIDVEPSQVLVCTAGSEALNFALTACLEPGSEVIVPEPFYANYIGFATWFDGKVVPVPSRLEDSFALPGTAEFERRITPQTRAILINNPGNPTGTVFANGQLEELAALCAERGLWLISDEVYRDFNFTGRPIRSVLQLEGLGDAGVMVDSVSKRYSLCGARVGFLVNRHSAFNDATARLAMARLSPPTLEQIGVVAAFRNTPASYFDDVREEYRSRRDLLVERIRAIPGAVCPEIEGAFYAMVRLPIDDSDRFCQWLLEDFVYEGASVMLAPGSGFYATPGGGKDEVRIAYVLGRERLTRAMDALEAALAAYPGTKVPTAQ